MYRFSTFPIRLCLFIHAEPSWKKPRGQLLNRFFLSLVFPLVHFWVLSSLQKTHTPLHAHAQVYQNEKPLSFTSNIILLIFFLNLSTKISHRKPDLGSFPSHTGHIFADMSFQLDYPRAAEKQETALNLKPIQTPETRDRQKRAAASLTTVRAGKKKEKERNNNNKNNTCRRTTDLMLIYAVLRGINPSIMLPTQLSHDLF